MNPLASAFPVACCGVSERMGNIIIHCGSKILRSLLRRASIFYMVYARTKTISLTNIAGTSTLWAWRFIGLLRVTIVEGEKKHGNARSHTCLSTQGRCPLGDGEEALEDMVRGGAKLITTEMLEERT